MGHTYGHHSVWQMWAESRSPINNPLMSWRDAIQQPGARQMKHGRALMESRPFFDRIPDPNVVVSLGIPTSVPGAGRYRFVATRDAAGTYILVYCPAGRKFTVDCSPIQAQRVRAWWYNPRSGESSLLGEFDQQGHREFTPPDLGEDLDWVLVLDDASKNYPPPGKKSGK